MADLLRMSAVVAGENEAVLTEWLIPEGGSFSPRDVVATVETAKASFEVEAETAGVLLRQLVDAGAQVTVGTPLAVTGAPGESADQAAAKLGLTGAPAAGPGAGANGASGASGASAASAASADAADAAPAPGREHGRIFASPIARRLARDAGVPIGSIAGTGPNGRIIRRDVEAAVASQGPALSRDAAVSPPAAARPATGQDLAAERVAQQVDRAPVESALAAASPAGPATAPQPAFVPAPPAPAVERAAPAVVVAEAGEDVRDVPHSRLRRAIAARLTESKQTAPHFYLRGTADVERLCRLREGLNASSPVKITLNDLVIKAAAHAHTRVRP